MNLHEIMTKKYEQPKREFVREFFLKAKQTSGTQRSPGVSLGMHRKRKISKRCRHSALFEMSCSRHFITALEAAVV